MIPILILIVLVLILAKLCYKPRHKFSAGDYRNAGFNRLALAFFAALAATGFPLLWILSAVLLISALSFFQQAKKLRSKEVERDLFIAGLN